ncbi:hydrolase [Actinocatenispora thailandica]|uniref:Hydrolase n=1 Tax=Actinocatenispora thailandica TaxID=227318 RepID=A0A7R7HWA2_9ACTN|nr:alpha/beta hydrolase [Actinocatenispora thailandica]BCJ33923.1 hydrolase [Actinocatenispora thailandica]
MNLVQAPIETGTLEVPGASLCYEVRGTGPLLLLIIPGGPTDLGAPSGVAACLADRYAVVTYHRRGPSRGLLAGPPVDTEVASLSDDAHRLLAALGSEPCYVVGNSGGALAGLHLTAHHPEQVRELLVHEPPLPGLLPDRDRWRAAFQDVHDTPWIDAAGTFLAADATAAGGHAEPPLMPHRPALARDGGSRTQGNLDYFLAHLLLPVLRFAADVAALRSGRVRITVGVGAASGEGVPARSARILAELLGVRPIEFPGDHQGLASEPAASAEIIRAVLGRT